MNYLNFFKYAFLIAANENLFSIDTLKNYNFREELLKATRKHRKIKRLRKPIKIIKPDILPTIFENAEFKTLCAIDFEKNNSSTLDIKLDNINKVNMNNKTNCALFFESKLFILVIVFYIIISLVAFVIFANFI